MKIWQRYLFFEFLKVALLFIGVFYFLYILIDYSSHSKAFLNDGFTFKTGALYYLCQFTKQAEILLPFALIVATIKVLATLRMHNELIALVTSGVARRLILTPLLGAAALCALLLYANFQILTPLAYSRIAAFEEHLPNKATKTETSVQALPLADDSVLIYQRFDPGAQAFFDVYWVKGQGTIYRIKTLYPLATPPRGEYVDLLVRNGAGALMRKESFPQATFSGMEFEGKSLAAAVSPPQGQSLAKLAKNIPWRRSLPWLGTMNDREAMTTTLFTYKMLIPLVCFLAIIAPAPALLQFGRSMPLFFIYALSLFGLIALFTLLNAATILGESQLFPPLIALVTPLLIVSTFMGIRYAKL